jgi:hypothetical protein
LVFNLAGEEMDLTLSFPGVAGAVVPISRPLFLSVRNKLIFNLG